MPIACSSCPSGPARCPPDRRLTSSRSGRSTKGSFRFTLSFEGESMGRIDPERIRNVALLGHRHDGKTSQAQAMLYAGCGFDVLGRPYAGNTTFDFEPEEVKRKISIGTAVAHLTWHDHKINLLDAPGFQDFAGEVVGALRAAYGG